MSEPTAQEFRDAAEGETQYLETQIMSNSQHARRLHVIRLLAYAAGLVERNADLEKGARVLAQDVIDWEERETAECQDLAFEEVIGTLREKVATLTAERDASVNAEINAHRTRAEAEQRAEAAERQLAEHQVALQSEREQRKRLEEIGIPWNKAIYAAVGKEIGGAEGLHPNDWPGRIKALVQAEQKIAAVRAFVQSELNRLRREYVLDGDKSEVERRRCSEKLEAGRLYTPEMKGLMNVVVKFLDAPSGPGASDAPDESPVLAFQTWITRYIKDRGGKPLTQDEYFLAQAAFFAAHPGKGPSSTLQSAPAPPRPETPANIPWRGVLSVEEPSDAADKILHLECGHTETWPSFAGVPTATKCTTCDPPTFHGRPFKWETMESAPMNTPILVYDALCGNTPDPPAPLPAAGDMK